MNLAIQHLDTELGTIEVCANQAGIVSILFSSPDKDPHPQSDKPNTFTQQACEQLRRYFTGELQQFDLPLAAQGTAFQTGVWRVLTDIAYGETCSYADIAKAIDNPKAVRAVGAANGKNPISIVVPCHRVIGANNILTGYAGGLSRKAWLLALEKQNTITE
jgi:methylated-DNA-[protein]-cysteine S-methyltransferase